jgi:Bacterial PH domain
MKFHSKKGPILGAIIWGTILFMGYALIFLPDGPDGVGEMLLAILICGLTSGFMLWLWFATYYEIGEEYLKIVSGPIRSKVAINKISRIRRSRNPLSSPALSTDRLKIEYGKWDFVLISPKNEERFCELLLKKNPNIQVNLNKNRGW